MNLDYLLKNFDLIAEMPGGVARLRELILKLAFSGGFKKTHNNDGLKSDWVESRIESIVESMTPGFACSKSHQIENGHVHLRTHNISTMGKMNFDLIIRINQKFVDQKKSAIKRNDILFNNTNSQELVGKTCLVERDYNYGYSNHITRLRLREGVSPGYVVYFLTYLRSSGFFSNICTRWINQAAINMDALKAISIPLPPLAEQKRIVAKVDELMALCDQLDAQHAERHQRRQTLTRAAIARFTADPTIANLQYLFDPDYALDPEDLRKVILSLAVRGKLVKQDPKDESVEKKYLQEPKSEIYPFNWRVLNFGKYCDIQGGNQPEKSQFIDEPKKGYIRLYQIRDLGDKPVPTYIPEKTVSRYCHVGEILIGRYGASVGKVFWAQEGAYNVALAKFIYPEDAYFSGFVFWMLKSKVFQRHLSGASRSAQAGFNKGDLSSIGFPLPPLAEQKRIVAKVDELMALCDQLDAQMEDARKVAERVVLSIVGV